MATTYIIEELNNHRNNQPTILANGLGLKEAYQALLDLFNDRFKDEFTASSWTHAQQLTKHNFFGATKTYKDKTRSFTWDGVRYSIERETTRRDAILEIYAVGSKVLPGLTIKTIGSKYVTCLSIYDYVHYVKYTIDEFFENFCNE